MTSMVGSVQPVPNAPTRKVDLVIPLNDDAASLLVKSEKVSLGLAVLEKAVPGLKFDRAVLGAPTKR